MTSAAAAGLNDVIVDCGAIPPRDRFDVWTDAVNTSFVPLSASLPEEDAAAPGFSGRLLARQLGLASTSIVSGSAVKVRRGRLEIARADPGHIKLGLQLHGSSVIAQDGRDAALAPGDFALYDTTRPYALDFDSPFEMLVVMFPLEALRLDRGRLRTITASRFSGRFGLGGVASSFLRTLSRTLDDGSLGTSAYVGDAVFDLVAAVIAERLDADGIPPDGSRTAMLARIETYIAAHLGERDLTVPRIAAAHHVSIRYLQKLFEDHDKTVTGWIRHRRLDEARRDLGDRSLAGRQVASIGARWGFGDAGAFSRAFRAEFGVSPSQYRAQSASE